MTVDTIIWVQLYYYFLSPNYFSWYLLVNPINWGKEFWRGQKNRKKESSTWFLPLLFSSFSPWIFGCPFASLNIKTCIDFVVCCNFHFGDNSPQLENVSQFSTVIWCYKFSVIYVTSRTLLCLVSKRVFHMNIFASYPYQLFSSLFCSLHSYLPSMSAPPSFYKTIFMILLWKSEIMGYYNLHFVDDLEPNNSNSISFVLFLMGLWGASIQKLTDLFSIVLKSYMRNLC